MARPFRTQLIFGSSVLLAVFLTVVAIGARITFVEQIKSLEEEARLIATSVMATADAARLERHEFANTLAALPVPDDGIVVAFDMAAKQVVAARGEPRVLAAIDLAAVPNAVRPEDPDGVHRAYAAEWTPDRKYQLVVGLPQRMAVDRIMPIYRRNAIFAGGWYLISVAALYMFLARWIRSVKTLESIATRVSAGDLRTPEPAPMATSELEQMQRTMADMITRVRELQRQVVRQERLAAIGTLVSGVAHEISNPLQAILGSTEVIQSNSNVPAEVQHDLAVIQHESVRAGAIIRNLTRFTRQQPAGPTSVKLTEIIQWLTELWHRRLVEQDISLEVEDNAARVALAESSEIQQVALNFLVNAEYAVLRGGQHERRVVVRTRDLPNGFVRLEVEDSGPGVKPEDEGKLFVPFFTTKPVGEGTGLGLSVSYGIIQSYGGTIGHERGSMGGARFFFEIPAS